MDNVNSSGTSEQQSQQFCLRWHNHQTSLLSTLPLLLDQCHLTDVTLSAEGKTLHGHRVVLSACSTFFAELFRNLDANFHPVIVIPGATFTTVVALLTFMYSGEVNVYEEQIPTLLMLAETLGIKGLADLQNNFFSKSPDTDNSAPQISTFQSFLMKPFQFYSDVLSQPLNFSQSTSYKTSQTLSKYQQQCQESKTYEQVEKASAVKRASKNTISGEQNSKDVKYIDEIIENLSSNSTKPCEGTIIPINGGLCSDSKTLQPSSNANFSCHFISDEKRKMNEKLVLDQHLRVSSYQYSQNFSSSESTVSNKSSSSSLQKSSNLKLYATCFICHKQLSNQYNLRVHLETHQNVRYTCHICSHVSRSKDALRKHVSYRHTTTSSLCDTEGRRKRSKLATTSCFSNKAGLSDRSSTSLVLSNQPSVSIPNNNGPVSSNTLTSSVKDESMSNKTPSTQ